MSSLAEKTDQILRSLGLLLIGALTFGPEGGLAATLAGSAEVEGNSCTSRWEVFSAKPYEQIALPDTSVRYWRFRYKIAGDQRYALRIKGRMPFARYMNFNIYDQKTQDSGGSLADRDIKMENGTPNPFQPGANLNSEERDYTVWLLPKGQTTHGALNVIFAPQLKSEANEQALELWYRVYVPNPGTGDDGQDNLPELAAFDAVDGSPIPCPIKEASDPQVTNALSSVPPANPAGKTYMFRTRASGLYANLDNKYLATFMPVSPGDAVVLLRFKPPTFPNTEAGLASLTGQEEVRYWSFCLGGVDQRTSSCLRDAEFKLDSAGYTTLVIGAEDLRATATERGHNFLAWGTQTFQVLVYRNLLTNPEFPGRIEKVKEVTSGGFFGADSYAAQLYIGDAAPYGKTCKKAAYLQNSCQ